MQYHALRKAASSNLTLYAAIALLITSLLSLIAAWRMIGAEIWLYFYSESLTGSVTQSDVTVRTVFLMIPLCIVAALPVISMFIIYINARSGASMNRISYTILHGMMVVLLVICIVLLPICLSILNKSLDYISICLSIWVPVTLLIAFSAASVLRTTREVVINGYSYRNFTNLLPIMLILALCLKAANTVALLLANWIPPLALSLQNYHITGGFLYACIVAASITGFVTTLLFLLLSFRGKKAVTRHSHSHADS